MLQILKATKIWEDDIVPFSVMITVDPRPGTKVFEKGTFGTWRPASLFLSYSRKPFGFRL